MEDVFRGRLTPTSLSMDVKKQKSCLRLFRLQFNSIYSWGTGNWKSALTKKPSSDIIIIHLHVVIILNESTRVTRCVINHRKASDPGRMTENVFPQSKVYMANESKSSKLRTWNRTLFHVFATKALTSSCLLIFSTRAVTWDAYEFKYTAVFHNCIERSCVAAGWT